MTGHHPRRALSKPVIAIGLALSLPLGGFAVAVTAPQIVGIAAAVVNNVQIKSAAAARSRPAAIRQRVALADQVQTGARSQLQLQLLDRSVFTVGANARLTIDRFVYAPGGNGSFGATVAKGAFRFMSGRRGDGKGTSINTPAATIGIRGTILDGVVGEEAIAIARGERAISQTIDSDPQTASLVILRGPGPNRQGNGAVGAISVTAANRTVELDRPLHAAYVPRRGAAPIGPFTISLPGLARLNELVVPAREPAQPAGAAPGYVPATSDRPRPPRRYRPFPPGGAFGGEDAAPPSYGVPYLPSLPDRPAGQEPRPQRPPQAEPQPQPQPQAEPQPKPGLQTPQSTVTKEPPPEPTPVPAASGQSTAPPIPPKLAPGQSNNPNNLPPK